MTFAHPKMLWFLCLLVAVIALWWLAKRSFRKRLVLYSGFRAFVGKNLKWSRAENLSRLCLYCVIFIALVGALAGPQWGFEWVESSSPGSDIMIVFDVSESMLAADIEPNRLEVAKRKVYDFIEQLKGDRVGLVAFAGTAFLHSPLTADYGAIRSYLNYLRTDLIPIQGTAIGKAIDIAKKSLKSAAPTESRAQWIILITDGEDQSDNMIGSAKDAYAEGIRVFALGVGSREGAPIPDEGGGFKKDSSGQMVLSKLNTSMLKKIAEVGGGKFAVASSLGSDLNDFYVQELNLGRERSKSGDKVKRWHNRFQYLLALALFLSFVDFVFWNFLPREIKRRRAVR